MPRAARAYQPALECQCLCVMSVGEPFEDNLLGFFWNPKAGMWIDLLALRRQYRGRPGTACNH
jgi:hypothetical protein